MKLETSNCVIWNPKHSAKYVCHIGHRLLHVRALLAQRNGGEQHFFQYTMDLLSIPNNYIKKGPPHGHCYGKKPDDYEYFVANSLKKKCKKKFFLGIHDRFIRDEKFRKNMVNVGRNEEICREMDKLANEETNWRTKTTRTTTLQKKLVCTATISGSVRTQLVPIRCQSGIELTSSKLCQPCDSSNTKKITAHQQRWKSYSSSWWNWQESWWRSPLGILSHFLPKFRSEIIWPGCQQFSR